MAAVLLEVTTSLNELDGQVGTIERVLDEYSSQKVPIDITNVRTTGDNIAIYFGQLNKLQEIIDGVDCPDENLKASRRNATEKSGELHHRMEKLYEKVIVCTNLAAEEKKISGNSFFKSGEYSSALQMYDEAISIVGTNALYYNNRALTLQKLDRHADALESATKAITLDCGLIKGYVIAIKCQLTLGKLEDAAQLFDVIPLASHEKTEVKELKEIVATASKDAGNAAYKVNNHDLALQHYTSAIKLTSGSNHLFLSNRSACYQAKGMWREAAKDAEDVLKINSKFAKGYLHLGRSQVQLKRFSEASTTLKQAATELPPSDHASIKSQLDEIAKAVAAASSSTFSAATTASDTARAEAFKTQGNNSYKQGEYQAAIRFYSQAIAACPREGTYYGNRAACWIMLKEYKRAISDCDEGIALEQKLGEMDKLRLRKATALTNIGKIPAAIEVLESAIEHNDTVDEDKKRSMTAFDDQLKGLQNIMSQVELGKRSLENGEYSRAKRLFQTAQGAGLNDDVTVRVLLARAFLGLGELEDSSREAQKAISASGGTGSSCIDAYIVRAEALKGLGFTEQACKHYTAAMQLDPDNQDVAKKLKALRRIMSETTRIKQAITAATNSRNYEQAISLCSEGLQIDKTSKKLMAEMHCNRSKAYQMLAKLQLRSPAPADAEGDESRSPKSLSTASIRRSLQDANSACYYDKSMLDAILLKVEALQSLERFEEAVSEMEQCVEGPGADDKTAHSKLKEAKMLLKKSKRVDLYAILGITQTNSEKEIKTAYRKAALKWHPDRHSSGTEEQKKEAERRFKEIGDAFELLTDTQKKRLWDEGYDRDEIEQRVEMEKQRQQHGGGGFGHYH